MLALLHRSVVADVLLPALYALMPAEAQTLAFAPLRPSVSGC
jgi:hypothetical protein